jgi:hypothetical protein
MLTTTSFSELMHAKSDIKALQDTKPSLFQQFVHVIHLTRQLQFKTQYMGSLIMDEETNTFRPTLKDDYVLTVYQKEIAQLKSNEAITDLKKLLFDHCSMGYATISDLVLGVNPEVLVGPAIAR